MKFTAKSLLVIIFIGLCLFVTILVCDSYNPIKAHGIVIPEREQVVQAISPADKERMTIEDNWADLEIQEEQEEEEPEDETLEMTTKTTEYTLNLSTSDQEILEKLAYAEMGSKDTKAMALIIRVVLNRVESPIFPDTVSGVVFQSCQFSPISNGSYYSATPNSSTHEALEMVMTGWDESKGTLFFDALKSSWASKHRTYAFSYAGVNFYY